MTLSGSTPEGRTTRAAAAILVVFYAVGAAAHLIPATRPLMVTLTPYVLLLFGLLVLLLSLPASAAGAPRGGTPAGGARLRYLLWAVVTAAATFVAEVVGVATGAVFGSYQYGEVLGARIAGVPLVIGFNWALVVLGAAAAVERIFRTAGAKWPVAVIKTLLTGLFAAGFDFAMEPTAVKLHYWQWSQGTIPLRNYLAWFLLAALAGAFYQAARVRPKSPLPIVYLLVQLCFFVILDLALPGIVSN